jgi:glucokinase
MSLLGIDLGGTKIAFMLFTEEGMVLTREKVLVGDKQGAGVAAIIKEKIAAFLQTAKTGHNEIRSIGISVPGIYYSKKGSVWAPNIPGWEDYPLLQDIKKISENIPVTIDSDRACYILGEAWQGNARGTRDAIFLAVGTGIGAGIMVDGNILRGANDIAGAIGWMALQPPFKQHFAGCGCFEYHASGRGLALLAEQYIAEVKDYHGALSTTSGLNSQDVFAAYDHQDPVAIKIIHQCLQFWGMAVANLVSLFNPEKIILGGGVFGPALQFLPEIKKEAENWAQPISIHQYSLEGSGLGEDAGVYGAAYLALKNIAK